jgi:hypothetical protein
MKRFTEIMAIIAISALFVLIVFLMGGAGKCVV